MSPKETAYIVERLAVRFMAMVADYERKLVEHRDSFGARTSADAKIIEGLRRELFMLTGLNDKLIVDREEAWKERDGLLTQVQNMRAEMQRLSAQLDWERVEINRLQWENMTMHKDAEDGYAEAIKVLGDPIALSKERDALRAEVAALQERLRASIARGDFAQMEVAALRPKYKVGDKLESYSSAVTIVGVRTVYDCQTDGAEYPVGHSEDELKERYEQTPKHPVKVGEWVRRLVPSPACEVGTVAKVMLIDDDASVVVYKVERIDGQRGVWFAKNCEPCDPPEATAKIAPKVGDTVRLVTHPERAQVAEHLRTALQWPWISCWGLVGQTGKVVKPLVAVAGAVAVALDNSAIIAWWPIDCLEVVAEATHDTDAGKTAAEAALKTEPVADEIKVGDVVKVVGASGDLTAQSDIGKIGEVLQLDSMDGAVRLSGGAGWVNHRDVRKVTT